MKKSHGSFSLMRLARREHGEAIKAVLEGESYLNLHVAICPAGGEFEIWVSSPNTASDDDVKEMTLQLLAYAAVESQGVPA